MPPSNRLKIPTAEAFEPLLHPSRDKGAWGGRGSGKSHFFGGLAAEKALMWPGDAGEGLRMVCIREVQKTLKQSAKKLIEDKLVDFGLGEQQGFKVFREVIETPGDGLITFQGMQDHTADSIKSLEGFHVAWAEEAQGISERSMSLLRPTIRWEDISRGLASELWWSWNPSRPTDPVDRVLRGANKPTGAVVVKANWSDNPWFPIVLEQERQDCINNTPERYGHTWEGEYATVLEGAYYAKHLTEAQISGRIGFFPLDPLLKVHAFFDIGSSSRSADATAIWIVQFIGAEIRVLEYYEAIGQPFDAHVNWLRANKYGAAVCILPHDGRKHDSVYQVTPQGFLREAGFAVEVVGNQGAGAALLRVDALRACFHSIRFNEAGTKGGREAIGWYHERKDEARGIGLGPDHDWSSHAADALGMMAIYHASIKTSDSWSKPMRRNVKGIA